MLNLQKLVIDHFVKELKRAYEQTYSIMHPQVGHILEWAGQLALENLANTDALYHDLEHTIMVTSVGQAILKGKHLCEGGVTPTDWLHFMMALLCHDIGYVKGVCQDDRDGYFATGVDGGRVKLAPGGTDAALTPYHVDRSKLFIRERFGGKLLISLVDADVIAEYIEMTRFPVPDDEFYKDTKDYRGLVRAADFIGQLGDPNYLRKIPALFYEFEETGMNGQVGYKSPGEIRDNYTKFYWGVVRPYIQDALRYLYVTQDGKQWIANLHSHVFDVEHQQNVLCGK
ncbi:MAG: Npun_R2479 family HD domain-containing metalloprotein [Ardenticatenaceae bacterium]